MVSGNLLPTKASYRPSDICTTDDSLAGTFHGIETTSYTNGSANSCAAVAQTCSDRKNGLRNFESIDISWKNLSYTVNSGKQLKPLVDNLSGEAFPGTLTAIMGPSGAGKTTLLNLLTGFYDKSYKGEVQINGYVRDQALFNKQSCYVMQEDRLLPALTVYEAISMSVELRMPTWSKIAKERMVERSIAEWGLGECRDTRTENLSGGQRKRLAIAQELVNNPPVLFLDEPTSGLDNVSSLMCVQVLKKMASTGHTVICSIHAPSAKIFSYFDRLYMVSRGRCIYNGRVDQLLPFLAQRGLHCPEYHNPADYICELASEEHSDHCDRLSAEFRIPVRSAEQGVDYSSTTIYGGKVMTEQERAERYRMYSFKVNQLRQFRILFKRCWLSIIRNKVATMLRLLAYAAFALMTIVLFYDIGSSATTVVHSVKLYFVVVCICVVQTVFPSTVVFPVEVSVLVREQRNCWYGLKIYYLAYYFAELPFLVVPISLFMGAIYYPTAQPLEFWRFAAMLLFSIQLSGVSQAIALAVSALCTVQSAAAVAFPIVSPAFMFCGAFAPRQMLKPYVSWLTEVSFVNHAYNGLLVSAYGYGRAKLPCDDFICVYDDPAELLKITGTGGDRTIHEFWLILVAMEAAIRILGFFLLRFRLSRKT
ncbi:ATP-binding cassette sub-family G member 1-like isoform X1 [Dermacentor silvarum]|uniref:ATP-binding cassette sub-family G member 1-like isoform X1 n=2 Tax=Dermacentor silvarum TaxID=543639 RepID=UPI00189B43C3|nr:ATP-binding cassette sub-family G member 1-like isoform X1 [Dermacentor silvarum]